MLWVWVWVRISPGESSVFYSLSFLIKFSLFGPFDESLLLFSALSCCLLSAAYCLLPTASCLLPPASCLLPPASCFSLSCFSPTAASFLVSFPHFFYSNFRIFDSLLQVSSPSAPALLSLVSFYRFPPIIFAFLTPSISSPSSLLSFPLLSSPLFFSPLLFSSPALSSCSCSSPLL